MTGSAHRGEDWKVTPPWETCVCGKRGFETRKAAKASRRHHRGEHMSAYRCQDTPRLWHIGHTPVAIIRGNAGRGDLKRRTR